MWDTAEHTGRGSRLSHDRPCAACGHATHTFLACSETCACEPPPAPGTLPTAAPTAVAAGTPLELTA
jgi:hypothetical protein